MTIIGADLSKYDPNEAAGEYPFVILNVEDPEMAVKADIAHAAGVLIMLYSWVYADDRGYSVSRSYAAEELLALDGIHVAHHWLDYEEKGCTPQDLQAASLRVKPEMAPVGTYTYLAVLPTVRHVIVGPLWLAYYPAGYNTVPYDESMSNTARNEGAVIHQWTSVAPPDGRDLNAILAERWYLSLGTVAPASPPEPEMPEGGDNMLFVTNKDGKTAVFIRQGRELWVRGFDAGKVLEPVLLTNKCAPHNFDLELQEGFGLQVVWAVADEAGKLVKVSESAFGPIAEVV